MSEIKNLPKVSFPYNQDAQSIIPYEVSQLFLAFEFSRTGFIIVCLKIIKLQINPKNFNKTHFKGAMHSTHLCLINGAISSTVDKFYVLVFMHQFTSFVNFLIHFMEN